MSRRKLPTSGSQVPTCTGAKSWFAEGARSCSIHADCCRCDCRRKGSPSGRRRVLAGRREWPRYWRSRLPSHVGPLADSMLRCGRVEPTKTCRRTARNQFGRDLRNALNRIGFQSTHSGIQDSGSVWARSDPPASAFAPADAGTRGAVATGSPPSHAASHADSVRKSISRGMTAMSDDVCIWKSVPAFRPGTCCFESRARGRKTQASQADCEQALKFVQDVVNP